MSVRGRARHRGKEDGERQGQRRLVGLGRRGAEPRALADLEGIGKAMLADLALLGIEDVATLAKQEPGLLYERLCTRTGVRHDPCVLDVFSCAVAQARDPALPAAQRKWWWWSRARKAAAGRAATGRRRG